MSPKTFAVVVATTMLGIWFAGGSFAAADQVDYPQGYRQWTHVKSATIQPGHPLYERFGGIHHIYANASALAAMQAGHPYPDGAVIVFDLLDVKADKNRITEAGRKVLM